MRTGIRVPFGVRLGGKGGHLLLFLPQLLDACALFLPFGLGHDDGMTEGISTAAAARRKDRRE